MNYAKQATAKSPALVIYLLDTSSSMATPMNGFLKDGGTRIAVVREAIDQVLRRMVSRSTKGLTISPRYHIAMAAYNHVVQPVTGKGPESVDQIASRGVPRLTSEGLTFTAQAFEWAEKLLIRELPGRANHPAPLICHMTDGEFNGDADPEPVVRRITRLSNQDGPVLSATFSSARRWSANRSTTSVPGRGSPRRISSSRIMPGNCSGCLRRSRSFTRP